jgi:hypothetical protein
VAGQVQTYPAVHLGCFQGGPATTGQRHGVHHLSGRRCSGRLVLSPSPQIQDLARRERHRGPRVAICVRGAVKLLLSEGRMNIRQGGILYRYALRHAAP